MKKKNFSLNVQGGGDTEKKRCDKNKINMKIRIFLLVD